MGNRSLTNRNESNKKGLAGSYDIDDLEEELISRANDLKTDSNLHQHNRAITKNWYGQRLKFLKLFYNKTTREVSMVTGFSEHYILGFEVNKYIPTEKTISKLAFMFEVPVEFFTTNEVTIKIKGQIEIEII
jgi:hypothetical protein